MNTNDFSTAISVNENPRQVFDAINNVRGWWSEEINGVTLHEGDVFDYHFEDIHRCKIQIIESIPGQIVAWRVLENYFKPGIFGEFEHSNVSASGFDQIEWVGTVMVFAIEEKAGKTTLTFTHEGLTSEYECFEVCATGWRHYINNSLYHLIVSGKGLPNTTGRPMTSSEKKFAAES